MARSTSSCFESESVLLRGVGTCRFERANEAWSFDGGAGHAAAFSAKWDASDRLPTLAIGNYHTLDAAGNVTYECADNALFRPNADGTGYGMPTVLAPGYCALGVLFSDWDRSGRRDLRITNDRQYYMAHEGQDQLWRVANGATPREYTDADGWVRLQIWGMGIASFDLIGNGYPDVYLTSQGDNKLQTLATGPSQPRYRDMASRRGITAAQPFSGGDVRPSTAWHPEFQDVNNDGFIDLFVSKGNVSTMREYASRDPSNLFIGQPDGTFLEGAEAAGLLNFARGRGAALADFNRDGRLDLVEVNYGDPARIWRNGGSVGNWLGLRVTQSGSNRDAVGAWIEVQVGNKSIRRELTIGGGHSGGQLGWTHFGLGVARSAKVRALWPDGEVGPWQQINANQYAVIERSDRDQTLRGR